MLEILSRYLLDSKTAGPSLRVRLRLRTTRARIRITSLLLFCGILH